MNSERIAIIDLGSNSSRLAIYQIYGNGAYQPIFEMKQVIRLAQFMAPDGRITEEGIRRAVACTKLFYRAAEFYDITRWFAVATAAIRQATNQELIVKTLQEQTGVTFRVLTGEEEGRYGFIGVVNTVEEQNALLFDIGGASTELMLMQNRVLTAVTSLPFGAVNLTEMHRHLPREQVAPAVRRFMRDQFAKVTWLEGRTGLTLIGMGGTARALAKIDRETKAQKNGRIHGYEVQRSALAGLTKKIESSTLEEIRKIHGVSSSRADLLPVGLSIIDVLAQEVSASKIIVSKNAVREGIFYEYFLRHKEDPRFSSVLLHSIENFQKLFHVNSRLALMITDVSLQLFDVLQKIHGYGFDERKLVQVAAQIENAGSAINTDKWAKHSAYLATFSHLYGLSQEELLRVSQLLSGKVTSDMKKLWLLIRIAKFFILQMGIDPLRLELRLKNDYLLIGPVADTRPIVKQVTEEELEKQFQKVFKVKLEYLESLDAGIEKG